MEVSHYTLISESIITIEHENSELLSFSSFKYFVMERVVKQCLRSLNRVTMAFSLLSTLWFSLLTKMSYDFYLSIYRNLLRVNIHFHFLLYLYCSSAMVFQSYGTCHCWLPWLRQPLRSPCQHECCYGLHGQPDGITENGRRFRHL